MSPQLRVSNNGGYKRRTTRWNALADSLALLLNIHKIAALCCFRRPYTSLGAMVVVHEHERGGMRRKRTTETRRRSGYGAGWMVVVSQALLLLTPTCAFQLRPPVSPPSSNVNHRGCDLSGRGTTPSSGSVGCSAAAGALAGGGRATTALGAAGGDDGDESFAEDKRYRRKPKGANLRRDAAGLPAEKVYAPRQSA